MSAAELYHRALSVSPSTSVGSCSPTPTSAYDSCEYAAAHLPPVEFMQRYTTACTTTVTTNIAGERQRAGGAGRLSPKSRHIAKRHERRERRAVLKKLRGMVGGDNACNQLEIIEHVINRIRELQETLTLNDEPVSPPAASTTHSAGGVSPAESFASLDSLVWASASDEESCASASLAGVSSDSALSSCSSVQQQQQHQRLAVVEIQEARRDDVQRLILQLSSVLSQLGAAANIHC